MAHIVSVLLARRFVSGWHIYNIAEVVALFAYVIDSAS